MSPVQQMARFHKGRDVGITPTSSDTNAMLTRELIRQATNPPAELQSTVIGDSILTHTTSLPIASTPAQSTRNTGLTTGSKIGLGMIPVILLCVGLYILFLFWYRKRRARNGLREIIPPLAPEKDLISSCKSFDSVQGTSKVVHMSAFSTPIYEDMSRADQSGTFETEPAPPRSPHMVEIEADSPIDRTSPFRLKRGDSVKRLSIGPDLARLWPAPPPSAWLRPSILGSDPFIYRAERASIMSQSSGGNSARRLF